MTRSLPITRNVELPVLGDNETATAPFDVDVGDADVLSFVARRSNYPDIIVGDGKYIGQEVILQFQVFKQQSNYPTLRVAGSRGTVSSTGGVATSGTPFYFSSLDMNYNDVPGGAPGKHGFGYEFDPLEAVLVLKWSGMYWMFVTAVGFSNAS